MFGLTGGTTTAGTVRPGHFSAEILGSVTGSQATSIDRMADTRWIDFDPCSFRAQRAHGFDISGRDNGRLRKRSIRWQSLMTAFFFGFFSLRAAPAAAAGRIPGPADSARSPGPTQQQELQNGCGQGTARSSEHRAGQLSDRSPDGHSGPHSRSDAVERCQQ